MTDTYYLAATGQVVDFFFAFSMYMLLDLSQHLVWGLMS